MNNPEKLAPLGTQDTWQIKHTHTKHHYTQPNTNYVNNT